MIFHTMTMLDKDNLILEGHKAHFEMWKNLWLLIQLIPETFGYQNLELYHYYEMKLSELFC